MKPIMIFRSKLQVKLTGIVVIAFGLMLVTSSMVLLYSISKLGKETIRRQLDEEQLIIEQRFTEMQQTLLETATAAARHPAIVDGLGQSDGSLIESHVQSNNAFSSHDRVWILDADQTIINSYAFADGFAAENAIQSAPAFPFSQQASETAVIIWDQQPFLAAFVPVFDSTQQVIGSVIIADVVDSRLLGQINFYRDSAALSLFVNEQTVGGVTASEANGQPHLTGEQTRALRAADDLLAQIQHGETVRLFDITVRGTPHAVLYQPLVIGGGPVGYYVIAIDEAEPRTIQSRILLISLGTLVSVLVLIGGLIAGSLHGLVILPLQQLSAAAQQLAEGQYSARLIVKSKDEIGRLCTAFNAMATSIETRTRQLNDLNLTLEQRVHERTLELERQSKWLETTVCEAKEAIIIADADGKIRLINDVALDKVWGIDRENALRTSFFSLIGHAVQPVLRFPLANDGYQGELEINDHVYLCSITYLQPGQSASGGFVCILTDITALHRLDALKTQIIRVASHDLRSPLTALGLQYYLLKKQSDNLSDRQLELIDRAQNNVADLQRMVDELLNLEHIERQAQGNCEATAVGTLLSSGVTMLKTELDRKKQHIDLQISDEIPFVCGDPVRLLEAIRNYLTNAVKYTPMGGRITARAYTDNAYVYVEVKDSGIGIDTEDVDHVFEANFRAQTALSSSEPGQGIGLSLVKAIIEEHGGKVWAESQVGVGSTFGLKLPIE